MNQQMTLKEKRNLGMNIRNLPPECLKGIWDIVSDGSQQNQEVL